MLFYLAVQRTWEDMASAPITASCWSGMKPNSELFSEPLQRLDNLHLRPQQFMYFVQIQQ